MATDHYLSGAAIKVWASLGIAVTVNISVLLLTGSELRYDGVDITCSVTAMLQVAMLTCLNMARLMLEAVNSRRPNITNRLSFQC